MVGFRRSYKSSIQVRSPNITRVKSKGLKTTYTGRVAAEGIFRNWAYFSNENLHRPRSGRSFLTRSYTDAQKWFSRVIFGLCTCTIQEERSVNDYLIQEREITTNKQLSIIITAPIPIEVITRNIVHARPS